MGIRFHAFAVICFVSQPLFAVENGDEVDRAGRQFSVEKNIDLLPNPLGNFNQKIALGEVPNNADGVITLKVRNRTQQRVVLGDQFNGCKCTEVSVSSPTIAPSGTEEIKISFSTRNEQNLKKVLTLQISPKDGESGGIRLAFEMNVAAVLAFKNNGVTLELSELEDSKVFRIPITLSSPIISKDVEVTGSGAVKISSDHPVWDEENSTWSVMATLAPGFSDGDTGSIRISHSGSEVEGDLFCAIRVTPNVRVIPNILRVTWNKDSKVWRASAAIQVSKTWLAANADHSRGKKLLSKKTHYEISAYRVSDLRKLKIQHRELSRGIVKVELEFGDRQNESPEVGEVSFEVRVNGKTLRSLTSAVLGGF